MGKYNISYMFWKTQNFAQPSLLLLLPENKTYFLQNVQIYLLPEDVVFSDMIRCNFIDIFQVFGRM